MKRLLSVLVLLASCSAPADTDEYRVVTQSSTNASGGIRTKEFFIRNGATNLIRRTAVKNGRLQIRIHQFFQNGMRVADHTATPKSSVFFTEPGVPFTVALEFDQENAIRAASISSESGTLLDLFTYTNGVFEPEPSSRIRKLNEISSDLGSLFSRENVESTTPEEFARDAQELVEKYKE